MHGESTSFRWTFGIEEEFFLAHPRSRALATSVPRSLLRACRRRFGAASAPELLHSQIEIVSPVLERCDEARETLSALRRGVAAIAADKDLRMLAAGTHPIAAWGEQVETPKNRYRDIMEDFQIVARRNVLCGLHVHVAVPPGMDRVALMNRVMPWLPAFLALSTSSPFWNRAATGLLSYRQAAYDEWPRTGIPDTFENEAEYARFVALLVAGGAARDASYLWWAIRPALRYPTLELRICDACTRLDDTLAIAALYRCLLRYLARRPDTGQALGCEGSLARVRGILAEGTSAPAQLAIFRGRRARGDTPFEALQFVVDWLAAATITDRPPAVQAQDTRAVAQV